MRLKALTWTLAVKSLPQSCWTEHMFSACDPASKKKEWAEPITPSSSIPNLPARKFTDSLLGREAESVTLVKLLLHERKHQEWGISVPCKLNFQIFHLLYNFIFFKCRKLNMVTDLWLYDLFMFMFRKALPFYNW